MRLTKGTVLLAACLVLMIVTAATATTATITDNTLVQKWKGTGLYGSGSWIDRIGNAIYETIKIDVVFSGADVKFQIYTNMPLTGDPLLRVPIADLALDLNNDGIFEKGVVLDPARAQGLYDVSAWKSSVDLSKNIPNFVYGGRYDQGDPKVPLTQITGTPVFDSNVSVVQNSIGGSPSIYRIDVDLGNINNGVAWNNLSLFWGTGTCDNDGIAGQIHITGIPPVPEPASILLLSLGLAGLVGLREKFTK